ncbi:MAG: hypothetical protein QI197_01885 [Candidatus Korarchaeota archaeon]|nr:hypothetical protein [Candidatus Korarchaeota archaeon]
MVRRVKVILYGLFPTVYFTASPCCRFPTPEVEHGEEQLSEYPWWMVHDLMQAAEIARRLSKYGRRVKVDLVSADSLKGIWISLRYGLRGEPSAIVNGWVFKGPSLDPDSIEEFVRNLLQR